MTRFEFWKIIDTGIDKPDLKSRNELLIENLTSYSTDDIISFEIHLREILEDLDHYHIMGILKVLIGMVTDDMYLYFRCWIISNGESFTSAIQQDGDIVLEKLDYKEIPEFEDLLYVATYSYGNKLGKQEESEDFPRPVADAKGLSYDMRDTTKGIKIPKPQLKKKYPKTWEVCRINPPEGSFCEILSKSKMYDGPSFS